MPWLGGTEKLEEILEESKADQVIIAMEGSPAGEITEIVNRLSEKDIEIKMAPSHLDILAGSVRTQNVLDAPLIDLKRTDTGMAAAFKKTNRYIVFCFRTDIAIAAYVVCGITCKIIIKRPGVLCTGTSGI